MSDSILTTQEFWKALEESGSINESRGMILHDLNTTKGKLRTFTKSHSYGEYIFDWSWADAYNRYGIPYYPKLLSMVPFTPATASHFMGPQSEWQSLLSMHEQLRLQHSSAHFLFTTKDENRFLAENGYFIRDRKSVV